MKNNKLIYFFVILMLSIPFVVSTTTTVNVHLPYSYSLYCSATKLSSISYLADDSCSSVSPYSDSYFYSGLSATSTLGKYYRGLLTFDTSFLNGQNIDSAYIRLYRNSYTTGTHYFAFTGNSLNNPFSYSNALVWQSTSEGTLLTNTVLQSSTMTFNLNAAGLAYINKNGYTSFMYQDLNDINDIANYAKSFHTVWRDTVYSIRKPVLVVTYSPATDSTPSIGISIYSPINNTVDYDGIETFSITMTNVSSYIQNISLYTNLTNVWDRTNFSSLPLNTHSFTINNFTDSKHYKWQFVACNNESNCTNSSLRTLIESDRTKPGMVNNVAISSVGTNRVTLTWTNPSDIDYSYVKVYKNGSYFGQYNSPTATLTDTTLLSNSHYNYTFDYTVDSSGNINTTLNGSNQIRVITTAADGTGTNITFVSPLTAIAQDNTGISVALYTNESSTCKFGTVNDVYASLTYTMTSSNSLNHTYTAPYLLQGTTREYFFICKNTGTNIESGTRGLNVTATGTSAPTITLNSPTNNPPNITTNSVTFSYTVGDDYGISYCNLYLNSIMINKSTSGTGTKSFSKGNLANNNYNWYVTCYDNSNQPRSTTSSTYSFTVYSYTPVAPRNYYIFNDNNGMPVHYFDTFGNFWFKGTGQIVGDLSIRNLSAANIVTGDLGLIGKSRNELKVGTVFDTLDNYEKGGCAEIYAEGVYTGSEENVYFEVVIDTTLGSEIGLATFSYSYNGSDSMFIESGLTTSDTFITLENGISIRFEGCSGLDFADEDLFEILIYPDPSIGFSIDTSNYWNIKINSTADWDIIGNVNISGDIRPNTINGIDIKNVTQIGAEVHWAIWV